jgi:hypothetical protein
MSGLRVRLVAVALLAAALAGAGAWAARGTLRLDASTSTLLAGDARGSESYERIGRLLGDRLPVAVFVEHDELFSDAGRDALARLGDALGAVSGVDDVKSLTHSGVPVRRKSFALDPRELIDSEPFLPPGHLDAAAWAARRERVLADPLARDVFVSGDGRHALTIVVAAGMPPTGPGAAAFADRVAAAARAHAGAFRELVVGGFPLLEREVSAAVRRDATRTLVAAAALVAAVLLVAFRSPWAVLLLMVLGGAGLCGVPLMLAAAGTGLNVYTAILLPLVAGLQLNFLAHLVAAVLDGERAGRDGPGVLRAALRHVTPPSALAAGTTALGLLALRASDVGLVKQFATVGAGAVAFALLVSLGPAWLLSLALGAGRPWTREVQASPHVVAWLGWLGAHRRAVLASALALAALGALGASRLRSDVRAIGFLDPSSDTRRALALLDAHFGGMNTLQLRVDAGRPGGVTSLPGVSHVYELSMVFERMQALWEGGPAGAAPGASPDRPGLPETDVQLELYATLLRAANIPLLDMLVDPERRVTSVIVRAGDMPGARWLALYERLRAFAEARRPAGATLALHSGMARLLEADARMVAAQRDSLGLAVLAVTLVLALVLRSPRLALLAVACNLLPLLVVFGVMGAAGVSLNSITVMVGALALGVAVDDAIHLLLWMRRAPGTPDERLAAALSAKARPVAATSAVMTSVFVLFLLSWFPPVATFGWLGALAMACALGATLGVLPALLVGRAARARRTADSYSVARS